MKQPFLQAAVVGEVITRKPGTEHQQRRKTCICRRLGGRYVSSCLQLTFLSVRPKMVAVHNVVHNLAKNLARLV